MFSMPWILVWPPLVLVAGAWLFLMDSSSFKSQAPRIRRLWNDPKTRRRAVGATLAGAALLTGWAIWKRRQRTPIAVDVEDVASQAAQAIEARAQADRAAREAAVAVIANAEQQARKVKEMTRDEIASIRARVDVMESAELDAELAAFAAQGNAR